MLRTLASVSFLSAPTEKLCFCGATLIPDLRPWVLRSSLLFVVLTGFGCQPKPVVVAPVASTPAPPPPPPPPPPKCEALSENCTATESTLLAVGGAGTAFTPPSGWKFAKLADRSVAVGPDGKSLLTLSEISSGNESALLESFEKLTLAAAIEKVKFDALKKRLKKPQNSLDANGVKIDLWEVGKATSNGVNPELRETGAGTLLVFVAHVAETRIVTGLGFVVLPDAEADAQKVMSAIQTVKGKP